MYVSGDVRPSRAFRSGAPRRVAGGGISLPVGTAGWILNPELTWSDTFSAATALTPRIESKFQRFTLRATVPIVLSRQEELSVTGAFEAGQQQNSAPDFGTLLQQDRLRVLRLGTDWARPVGHGTAATFDHPVEGPVRPGRAHNRRCRCQWRRAGAGGQPS